jgi:hypothetical protein
VNCLGLPNEAGYQPWQVASPDAAMLALVGSPSGTAPGMTMLVYKAVGAGQTAIIATSEVDCPPGQQCGGTIRRYQQTVVVVPG